MSGTDVIGDIVLGTAALGTVITNALGILGFEMSIVMILTILTIAVINIPYRSP